MITGAYHKAQPIDAGLPKIRQLLSPVEVALYLRCSESDVRRLVKSGELTSEQHDGLLRIHRQTAVDLKRRQLFEVKK